jgi:hypothetical protein
LRSVAAFDLAGSLCCDATAAVQLLPKFNLLDENRRDQKYVRDWGDAKERQRAMSLKISISVLAASFAIASLAASVGAGAAAVGNERQSPLARNGIDTSHRLYRYPGGIAPGIYSYALGHGRAPCDGINCGLPGGHPRSDYFKVGNGDHGNDGGNGD